MKHVDYFFLRIVVFIFCFAGLSYLIDSLIFSILAALICTFVISLIIDLIGNKRNNAGYDDFLKSLILGGNDIVFNTIKIVLNIDVNIKDNYMTTDNEMIINAIKYGNITPDEIVKYHRIATENNITCIYLIARQIDRRSASVMNTLKIHFIFISARHLYKLTGKDFAKPKEEKHTKTKLTSLLNIIFSRANAKHFIFTSLILVVMSLFTPLKVYYMVISAITIILAVICLSPIGDNSYHGKKGIFEKRK